MTQKTDQKNLQDQKSPKNPQTVVLIVLDGWGYRQDPTHNAIAVAKTPNFARLWDEYPHTLIEASGLAVGLPHGQMGNSEIGHTTIGAGKIIDTDLVRIAKAIDSGVSDGVSDFASNSAFVRLFNHVKKHGSILHVKGLIGTGGVHAHSDHLYAFLRAAKQAGVAQIAIHAYTDGRDTGPQSAAEYIRELEAVLAEITTREITTGEINSASAEFTAPIARIVSATGRFYAMDRDNNWDRIKRAEDVLFAGEAPMKIQGELPSAVLERLYKTGTKDEGLEPIIFLDESGKAWKIAKNDGVFFFNFRSDRARQITTKVAEKIAELNLCFVTMTEYDKKFNEEFRQKSADKKSSSGDKGVAEILVAFPPSTIETTLAAEVAQAGLSQAHIAETEKFPHATYFLNGGRQDPHPKEEHIMLASRKDVPTHDLAPKMRADAIADKAIEQIERGTNFIFINFANPDMVGHTANVAAIVEAVEEVDKQLGRVVSVLQKLGTDPAGNDRGVAFVTADHGNAETNIDAETGEKHTAHTVNPVPVILTSHSASFRQKPVSPHIMNIKDMKLPPGLAVTGTLADIAPTILALMHLPQPAPMTGTRLII